ncbi:MAG: hypothetical protein LBL07_08260, partial [Tannerella sp.]|nr:hypothetical protein [Tannerella sp.]
STFEVQPKTGLAAGTYTDTVRVTAGGISALFTVRFRVDRKYIDITGGTVTPKPYDGNTSTTVGSLTFSDPVATAELVSGASYTDNANAGTLR